MLIAEGSRDPPTKAARVTAAEGCPYPGLRPFSERDAKLFFGREGEVAALLEMLEAQQLVVVHGASGCGKSSLVRAGLLPLFRTDALANDKTPVVVIVRPADEGGPLHSLAQRLTVELGTPSDRNLDGDAADADWATLLTTSRSWAHDIGARVSAAGKVLCILFDQFEEVFAAERSVHAPQVRRIIEFLNGLDEAAPAGTALGGRALTVVVTMRSDYLGHCAAWDSFAETVNRSQYLLPRISNFGLLRAIYEPARLHRGSVDESVADNLLSLVKSELDGLPIVQHALMRAWQHSAQNSPDQPVILDDGALYAVGGAGQALSDHADQILAEAVGTEETRAGCAEWMLRALCDLDSDGRIIRRSVSFQDLYQEVGAEPAVVRSLLDPFRRPENSLIMPPEAEALHDDTIITVSHEALLRRWGRISDLTINDRGQIKGYAYRELQDGLVWRALSVQAQQFARDGSSILGPASTEQRLPWFCNIEMHPGWIKRHQMNNLAGVRDFAVQWQQVRDLMKASEANLIEERNKLEREQQLVATLQKTVEREQQLVSTLRQSRTLAWRLQVVAIALLVIVSALGIYMYQTKKAQFKQQKDFVEKQTEVYLDINNAYRSAYKFCSVKTQTPEFQACVEEMRKEYYQYLRSSRSSVKNTPMSPYSQGSVKSGLIQKH